MQEIRDEDYIVKYDLETGTIAFQGELALGGPSEYQPIKDLLYNVADSQPETMTLNLRELEFLNSSGISMFSKFILSLKKNKDTQVIILGSSDIAWQSKSLRNFQKLLPTLKLEIN